MNNRVENILTNYPEARRENLIPILQDIQETEGYLSKQALVRIGRYLNLPTSKIYGVATFYNQFRFQPVGKYHIQVCRGTACHVKGSASVLKTLEQELKIKSGQTTRDGLFSIEVVACIGACGLAPVISVNGAFFAAVDSVKIRKLIKEFKNREKKS